MASLYDLDPKIRKLLSLDNYLDNLSVYEFIEELGNSNTATTPSSSRTTAPQLGHLDPKPYIRTFESTLKELKKLGKEAQSKQDTLAAEVSQYELDHSRNVISLASRTDSVNSQFKVLDDEITVCNSTVRPLTDDLTRILKSKERSLDAVSVIQIYVDFYKSGESQQLDHMMNGASVERRKCAGTVSQLLRLSVKLESDELPESKKTSELIQKYSELMETSLLEDFNNEYRRDNFQKMKEIVEVLTEYNGGDTVVKNFVNQNQFFLDSQIFKDQETKDRLHDEKFWDELSDPSSHVGLPANYSDQFYEVVKNVIHDETIIIMEVFENPISALTLFVQRVYVQQIQSRIESLLKISYSSSTLAYLRTLHSLYLATGEFTRDLCAFFQSQFKDYDLLEELIIAVEQSYNELFIQHLSDSKYSELEKKILESIFINVTSVYEGSNEMKLGSSKKSLSQRLEEFTHPKSQSGTPDIHEYEKLHRNSRVGQLKSYMRTQLDRSHSFKRTSSTSATSPNPNQQRFSIDQSKSKMNITEVESLLKSTVESLSRIIELNPSHSAQNGLDILEILLLGLGKSYVDLGLEISYAGLHSQDYRSEVVSFAYLDNITQVSEILLLMATCIRTIVLPLANNSPGIRQRMVTLTNGYVSKVELSVNLIVADTVTLFKDRTQFSLSKQKKKDFLPKVGELVDGNTDACESLVSFIEDGFEQIKEYLNGENLNSVLREIGVFIFDSLFEHFKNYQVNTTGGVILTTDIIAYQNAVDKWQITDISKKFQLLREIANLFTVNSELINSLTKDGQLVTLKPYVLRQFINKRVDDNDVGYFDRLVSEFKK
ncbi:hypothetical protein WICPIJ_008287 [Wickerhamomyces pijperi]|uniref:Exocyst complex component Sec10 n=1 Tax=Wickerhamomyces pijperi TaxID=599730 RepID=A0A9P8PY33_WICPI|nr:hypothetical protein WICPIJ_008287 [Wickerhamomyces pijperi]